MKTIAIHAAGYVGLTAAVHYARAGCDVILYDPDLSVIEALNSGQPKAGSFLAYLGGEPVLRHFQIEPDEPRIRATPRLVDTLVADAHLLAVPSEKNGQPFMDIVLASFGMLCADARDYAPIIVESTVMPGVAAKLRELAGDRPWAIAPRRDWFADQSKNLETLTRIVGLDHHHWKAIEPIITLVCRDVKWTIPETAELTKALENALLHLPVMLIHELALLFPEYDVAGAAQLASSHWRFKSFGGLYSGIGTGGRCVPLGSRYLSTRGGALLLDALELDENYADEVIARSLTPADVERIQTIAVLGIAYRPGFKDAGNSPGLRAAAAATMYGSVVVNDPYFTTDEIRELLNTQRISANIAADPVTAVESADLVILATAHPEYDVVWQSIQRGSTVIDATGLWEDRFDGFRYVRPGRPGWAAIK